MSNVKAIHKEIEDVFGQVPKWLREMPEPALSGFWNSMRDFHLAETSLPNKTKELIGIAVSGATGSRYCTLFHTEAARLFGASEAEIAEAAAVAGVTVHAGAFLNSMQVDYGEFRQQSMDMIAYARKHQPRGKAGLQPSAAAH